MSTAMMRRAVRLFPAVSYQPLSGTKYLRRQWLQAVVELGDRWILAKPIGRKQ